MHICTLHESVIVAGVCVLPLGSEVLSSLGVVVAAYLSLYPIVLIFPFLLTSYKVRIIIHMHMIYGSRAWNLSNQDSHEKEIISGVLYLE